MWRIHTIPIPNYRTEEKATAQEEIEATATANREWAERVVEAQSNIRKKNRRYINMQKQSRISPQRQAHLKNWLSSKT